LVYFRVEKNPGFLKKNNPPGFFLFFSKKKIFLFFKKKQDFVRFKENKKPHSELFLFHHAISLFSELHNHNLL